MAKVTITGMPSQQDINPVISTQQPEVPEKVTITSVPEESWGQLGIRNVAAMGKGALQRTFGALGNVREVLSDVTEKQPGLLEQAGGKILDIAGIEGTPRKIAEAGLDIIGGIPSLGLSTAYKYAPTTEQVGKGITNAAEYFFGVQPDYFKPKGKTEKILHSSAKDLASNLPYIILGPIGIGTGVARSIMPNIAKMVAKSYGAGKKAQMATKFITQLGMGFFGNYDPKTAAKTAYKTFEQKVPETARIEAKNAEVALSKINNYLKTPVNTKSKKILGDVADELFFARSKITHPKILDLFNAKNNISEIIKDPKTTKKAKAFLIPLKKGLVQDVRKGAANVSKDALKSFDFAEGVLRNMHQSIQPFQFIKDKFSNSKFLAPLSVITTAALGIATGGAGGLVPTASHIAGGALRGTLGAAAGGGIFKTLDMIFKGPAMWNYYTQVLVKAATQNVAQTARAIRRLDKEIKKRVPKNQ